MSTDFETIERRYEEALVYRRKELLAKMAATIAGGISEDWSIESKELVERAVDIAETILKRLGL